MPLAAGHGSVNCSAMNRKRGILTSFALTALLVLALVSSGFAHRFVASPERAELQVLETLGIDLASICGDETPEGMSQDCDACRLQAGMSLPEPILTIAHMDLSARPVSSAHGSVFLPSQSLAGHRLARAPPQV